MTLCRSIAGAAAALLLASAGWAAGLAVGLAADPAGDPAGGLAADPAGGSAGGSAVGSANALTALEQRWLQGVWPVVVFARASALPLDIVVQPQPTPGAAPLALAFVDGRCKLVLSMRGNPQAQATLDRIEPGLLGATLELMAAHELGHCRRYLAGAWYGLPAGFAAHVPTGLGAAWRALFADMQAARREEGYADLVGLAWARQRHAQHYPALRAWLLAERSIDLVPGSHHDTGVWVRLAGDGHALARAPMFDAAATLWAAGLRADD